MIHGLDEERRQQHHDVAKSQLVLTSARYLVVSRKPTIPPRRAGNRCEKRCQEESPLRWSLENGDGGNGSRNADYYNDEAVGLCVGTGESPRDRRLPGTRS